MALIHLELPWESKLDHVVDSVRNILRRTPKLAHGERGCLAAARVLGWVSPEGTPTPAGIAVASCFDATARISHAAFAFEASWLGRAWLAHAGAQSLRELSLPSAHAFLADSTDVDQATAGAAATTLRHWLVAMQAALLSHPDLPMMLRHAGVDDSKLVALAGLLASPCDDLVPARIATWARHHGVRYMHELATEDPQAMRTGRTLGPRGVAEIERVFLRATGHSWRKLRALLVQPSSGPGQTALNPTSDASTTWDGFRLGFPAALRELPLRHVQLPARMRNTSQKHGFETIADLLSRSETDLLTLKTIGAGTLRQTMSAMLHLLETIAPLPADRHSSDAAAVAVLLDRTLDRHANWLAILYARLDELKASERLVFARRAGLDGNVETLRQIGRLLGVSSERVRTIELAAIERLRRGSSPFALRARVLSALARGPRDAADLASDPFFAKADELAGVFDYVLERVLDAPARVLTIGGRAVVARTSPDGLTRAMAALRGYLRDAGFPIPYRELERLVERHIGALDGALEPFILDELRSELAIGDGPDGRVVLGRMTRLDPVRPATASRVRHRAG